MTARRTAIAASVLVTALAGSGCGGSAPRHTTAAPPPARAQDFPAANSPQLATLVESQSSSRPQLAPSVSVLKPGRNRLGFGLFEVSGKQLRAPAAVYVATTAGRGVQGPFVARLESLSVSPPFRSRTSSQDPDAASSVYVADVPFRRRGSWLAFAVVRSGGRLMASSPAQVRVGGAQPVAVGARAPRTHTPTMADVHGDVSKIDTRIPPDAMHSVDFADVVGRQPVVLVFATPQLCQSRVCGPVVDEVAELQSQFGNRAAFIHMEIYRNNKVEDGFLPQLGAWGLRSEPWIFTVDRHGRIAARLEGAASLGEIRQAVERALR